MKNKIIRLDFAHIGCKASILVEGMPEDQTIKIGCFAYLVEHDGKTILIDTGIEDITTVNLTKSSTDNWKRGQSEYNLLDNLQKNGVKPEEIQEVYLTHSHYDHISGLCHLTNARVYMSAKEWIYLHSESNLHRKYLGEVLRFLDEKRKQGQLFLIEKPYAHKGIRCVPVGGHTPGTMLVYVEDSLFTGEAVFLLENVEKNRPIGFCNEPQEAENALHLCRMHKGRILTGHDYRCE